MKAADQLKAAAGARIRESMGANATAAQPNKAPAAVPTNRYAGLDRIKGAFELPLDRIVADTNQPRREFDQGSLVELAASMRARGQLQPCLVRWDEALSKWVIIAGERRFRAATLGGLSALSCVEFKGELSADDLLELALIENALREDLKPLEQANAFKALIDRRGWTYRELAANLHIATSSVARALALLDLPTSVQEQVASGELAPSVAYEVAKAGDADTIREVAAEVVSSGLTRGEAIERVRRATKPKGRGVAKARPPKPRTFRTSAGKATLEPKHAGGLLELARQIVAILEVEQDGEAQNAA
jgi:ParB family chromosome partitioning protein